jgi:hypothetical protein
MDKRSMVLRHLAQAEQHVALGEQHIAQQRETVANLERDGHQHAAATARALLQTFEEAQASRIDDRERLRAELAALG